MAAGLAANAPTTSRTKQEVSNYQINRDEKPRPSSLNNKARQSGYSSIVLNNG
jgi:hypothetical protein